MSSTARRRLTPERRRKEIIEAAEKLLRQNGPEVRVEDVVREAAAAKGTFYLYFPTWDDLLDAIRTRLIRAFDEANPPAAGGSESDWHDQLDRLAVAFVDAITAMGGLHTVLFHTDFARRRPIPEEDDPPSRLTSLIRAGQAAGDFVDLDPDSIGRLLFAVVHETADAVESGEDRESALSAMRWILRRAVVPEAR